MDVSQTLKIYFGHIEDKHVGFLWRQNKFLTELQPLKVGPFLAAVWQLFCTIALGYNQFLQFLKDSFQTLNTYWEHNEDIHTAFYGDKIYFDRT